MYCDAQLKVVQLSGKQQLLAGSDAGGGGGGNAPMYSNTTSMTGLGSPTSLQ